MVCNHNSVGPLKQMTKFLSRDSHLGHDVSIGHVKAVLFQFTETNKQRMCVRTDSLMTIRNSKLVIIPSHTLALIISAAC